MLASHELSVVDKAERVIVLDDGLIAFDGSPAAVKASTAWAQIRGSGTGTGTGGGADESAARGTAPSASPPADSIATAPVVSSSHVHKDMHEDVQHKGAAASHGKATVEGAEEDAEEEGSVDAGKLTAAEDRETGSVRFRVLVRYAAAAGPMVASAAVLLLAIKSAASVGPSAWVSVWTADVADAGGNATLVSNATAGTVQPARHDHLYYIGVYAALSLGAVIIVLVQQLSCVRAAVSASAAVHADAFRAVIRAPMRFFETTPTGRLLARFGNDMSVIDTNLMNSLNQR